MKTAIYIEDGVVQLVLTPESDFENNAVASFSQKPMELDIFNGSFYDCRGGWTRFLQDSSDDKSLILRISEKKIPEIAPIDHC